MAEELEGQDELNDAFANLTFFKKNSAMLDKNELYKEFIIDTPKNFNGIIKKDNYFIMESKGTKYTSDESVILYEFDEDMNEISRTELDKCGWYGFTAYPNENKFVFCGANDDSNERLVYSYGGSSYNVYVNYGRFISIYDKDKDELNRYRVLDDYDDNTNDSNWFAAMPAFDRKTEKITILFTDIKDFSRKQIRIYDINDIINGDYDKYESLIFKIEDYKAYKEEKYKYFYFYEDTFYYTCNIDEKEDFRLVTIDVKKHFVTNQRLEYFTSTISQNDKENYDNIVNTCLEIITIDNNGLPEEHLISGIYTKNGDEEKTFLIIHQNGTSNNSAVPPDTPGDLKTYTYNNILIGNMDSLSILYWDFTKDNGGVAAKLTYDGDLLLKGNNFYFDYDGEDNKLKTLYCNTDSGYLRVGYNVDNNYIQIGGDIIIKNNSNNILLPDLPSSDPGVKDAIYRDGDTIKVSGYAPTTTESN